MKPCQVDIKEYYTAPTVEILEIKVEKGFATSSAPWDDGGTW